MFLENIYCSRLWIMKLYLLVSLSPWDIHAQPIHVLILTIRIRQLICVNITRNVLHANVNPTRTCFWVNNSVCGHVQQTKTIALLCGRVHRKWKNNCEHHPASYFSSPSPDSFDRTLSSDTVNEHKNKSTLIPCICLA